jgi:hypothetical protein
MSDNQDDEASVTKDSTNLKLDAISNLEVFSNSSQGEYWSLKEDDLLLLLVSQYSDGVRVGEGLTELTDDMVKKLPWKTIQKPYRGEKSSLDCY